MKYSLVLMAFYGLATFRLALMLSDDVGPWGVFSKLRSFLKREAKDNKPIRESKVHIGISCQRCTSIWIALPVAVYAACRHRLESYATIPADVFLSAMALSALAIIFNRAFPKR